MRIVIPDDFPPEYQGYEDLERLSPYGEVVLYGTKAASKGESASSGSDPGGTANAAVLSGCGVASPSGIAGNQRDHR